MGVGDRVQESKGTEMNQRFPLQEKSRDGMVVSLHGVLGRAADALGRSRDNKHLRWPLEQLNKHIEHLRASDSDEQALERLEEFMRLWIKD